MGRQAAQDAIDNDAIDNDAIDNTVGHVNEVHVVGRVAAPPGRRVLPSGETVVRVRLVVNRGVQPRRASSARTPTLDTLHCVAWTASTRRTVSRWEPDDVVDVLGALRRRFWRTPSGIIISRYEIEVASATRWARRRTAHRPAVAPAG